MITMELHFDNGEVLTVMMPTIAELFKLCLVLTGMKNTKLVMAKSRII